MATATGNAVSKPEDRGSIGRWTDPFNDHSVWPETRLAIGLIDAHDAWGTVTDQEEAWHRPGHGGALVSGSNRIKEL